MDGMKVLKTIRTTDKTLYAYDKTHREGRRIINQKSFTFYLQQSVLEQSHSHRLDNHQVDSI
jgi:hypothetical protein